MIDEMDEKILKEYLVDSRRSFGEIARILKISPGTVVSRIRDLEEKGIITKYTAQIDYEKLGYELTVISEITVSMGMTEEVGREVTRIKGTCAIYNVTGDSDMMVIAKFKGREDLSSFTKRVLKIENVERTKTHLALITLKEDFNIL